MRNWSALETFKPFKKRAAEQIARIRAEKPKHQRQVSSAARRAGSCMIAEKPSRMGVLVRAMRAGYQCNPAALPAFRVGGRFSCYSNDLYWCGKRCPANGLV